VDFISLPHVGAHRPFHLNDRSIASMNNFFEQVMVSNQQFFYVHGVIWSK